MHPTMVGCEQHACLCQVNTKIRTEDVIFGCCLQRILRSVQALQELIVLGGGNAVPRRLVHLAHAPLLHQRRYPLRCELFLRTM